MRLFPCAWCPSFQQCPAAGDLATGHGCHPLKTVGILGQHRWSAENSPGGSRWGGHAVQADELFLCRNQIKQISRDSLISDTLQYLLSGNAEMRGEMMHSDFQSANYENGGHFRQNWDSRDRSLKYNPGLAMTTLAVFYEIMNEKAIEIRKHHTKERDYYMWSGSPFSLSLSHRNTSSLPRERHPGTPQTIMIWIRSTFKSLSAASWSCSLKWAASALWTLVSSSLK